jgi:ribosomal protein S24E
MKLNILEEIENALFDRKEVKATLESDITPKLTEATEELAKHFSVPAEAIKVRNILGSFGSQVFDIDAHIYKTKEDKEKTEVKTKQEIEAEKKAAEVKKAEEKAKQEAALKEQPAETPQEENNLGEKKE